MAIFQFAMLVITRRYPNYPNSTRNLQDHHPPPPSMSGPQHQTQHRGDDGGHAAGHQVALPLLPRCIPVDRWCLPARHNNHGLMVAVTQRIEVKESIYVQ